MIWLVQFFWGIFYFWLLVAALTLFSLARHRTLRPAGGVRLKGDDAPSVSVLVPARNEEGRVLVECVRSILAQDYGNFDVVAVNDRSTDATGLILRALAAGEARLRVVEGGETPAGWLGKPFALQQALEASCGSWVLATDADMIFRPSVLRAAVAYAVENKCDALTLVPHFDALSFWERVFMPAWFWAVLIMFQRELANSSRTSLALGVGGFYLIRRAALERVGGFGAVRAEVLDDLRLAETLKRSGARTFAEYAPELVSTRMYSNLSELWESCTKNTFAILRFSTALTLAMLAFQFFVVILPPALAAACVPMFALGHAGEVWRQLFAPTLATWALFVSLLALVNRKCGVPAVYALTAPLGWVLSCAVMAASAYGVLSGRGLIWKGRKFYTRGGVRPPRASH
ncbi:MAG TPA: glycosyltransferase family 2 protein [Pyrinomonadaceae bacterium]|jgi:chlorobactene glucosyltransferase|nr:glycosyltransferase family 2 protein [Pyrinomonadaceae bacterium]